jgi:hypothetical protein
MRLIRMKLTSMRYKDSITEMVNQGLREVTRTYTGGASKGD